MRKFLAGQNLSKTSIFNLFIHGCGLQLIKQKQFQEELQRIFDSKSIALFT